jgi:hypothetical protein
MHRSTRRPVVVVRAQQERLVEQSAEWAVRVAVLAVVVSPLEVAAVVAATAVLAAVVVDL